MPKTPTFPTLIDECRQFSITDLKRFGCFENLLHSCVLSWGSNSIDVLIDRRTSNPYMILSYNTEGDTMTYKVRLTTQNSNLGIGVLWYFVCPISGIRCRKLHQVGRYFAHRSQLKGAMYYSQTLSKFTRDTIALYKMLE